MTAWSFTTRKYSKHDDHLSEWWRYTWITSKTVAAPNADNMRSARCHCFVNFRFVSVFFFISRNPYKQQW